jgi:hypothetical protein
MTKARMALTAGSLLLLTACGSGAVSYVSSADPVIRICQLPAIGNLGTLQTAVDNANNTNPSGLDGGPGYGQELTLNQVSNLKKAAASLTTAASQVSGHYGFQQNLLNEADELTTAADAPGGLTTNTVAIATDKYTSQVETDCGSFRIGTAPAQSHGKPGPGIWDWSLFWLALGGYLLMIPVASVVISFSEREKPRAGRWPAGKVFLLSVLWWVSLLIAAANAYRQLIGRLQLTPDERKDDRITTLQLETKRLEKELKMGKKS